jgi:hypothetical protein
MKATTRPVVSSRPTPRQRKYDSARHKRLKPSGHPPSIDATNLESPLGRAATEWRLTIDAIPDVIVVCDPNGAIHRLNRSGCYCSEAPIRTGLASRYPPSSRGSR